LIILHIIHIMNIIKSFGSSHKLLGLSVLALLCTNVSAAAPTYPTRPVRIVVGFPPGGGVDTVARLVSPKLIEMWGQQVVIDNRPGAGTIIGTDLVAKSVPDGYTLLMSSSSYGVNPGLHAKLPYDPLKDLVQISQMAIQPYVFAVHPGLPATNVREFIAYARTRPGKLNFCSPGNGSGGHLASELFSLMTKIEMVHVPYRGAAPAIVDLVAGQVQLMFSTILPSLPHVKSGRLRAIAVSTAKRSIALPEVPTIAESGVAGYEASSWTGVMAPTGVAPALLAKLHQDLATAVTSPDVRAKILVDGAEPVGSSPQEFARMVRAEIPKWTKVIKAAKVTAN
jgi:tripartite-type tricarboxylate transporter receptor subunit TctC